MSAIRNSKMTYLTLKHTPFSYSEIPTLKWCRLYGTIKSVKTGDWDLHMYASEKMLYWFHSYDNYSYARHFSYYWASQQTLGQNHPSIFQYFKESEFSIRRTARKFNKVSPDQAIEQSINKDKKKSR